MGHPYRIEPRGWSWGKSGPDTFVPIVYDNFGLPVEESSPPTDREETLDETSSEEELRLTHEVEEDEERWRTR